MLNTSQAPLSGAAACRRLALRELGCRFGVLSCLVAVGGLPVLAPSPLHAAPLVTHSAIELRFRSSPAHPRAKGAGFTPGRDRAVHLPKTSLLTTEAASSGKAAIAGRRSASSPALLERASSA